MKKLMIVLSCCLISLAATGELVAGTRIADWKRSSNPRVTPQNERSEPEVDIGTSTYEVMLGTMSCNDEYIYLDISASGGSLAGLTREISGGGNYIPTLALELTDCNASLVLIEDILRERDCLTAPRGYTTGRALMCDGERNEVVRTLGQILRTVFERAAGN